MKARLLLLLLGIQGIQSFQSGEKGDLLSKESHIILNSFPQRRTPRRFLPKQTRRRRRFRTQTPPEIDTNSELRPLVNRVELGEDYWIDPADIVPHTERKPRPESQVSDERLLEEALSPYKQNWIGWISVSVVVWLTLVTQFPELSEPTGTLIRFPDL